MLKNQLITVDLEDERASLDKHLASGDYDSPGEVLRAGLRALDREKLEFEQALRKRLQSTNRDRSEARPAAEVLNRLRMRHLERWGKMPDEE